MVDIRKATLADKETVASLIKELGQAVGLSTEIHAPSWYSTLRQMIVSPEWTFLLAEEDDEVAGLLVLLIVPSLKYGANIAVITELIVSESFRGKKVGRLLVEEALMLARSQGCAELTVSLGIENEDAIAFYEKLGFDKKPADFGMEL